MVIRPRSEKVNSAENALKKSINHFTLINYNFPSEAADCIHQLHLALELIVKEYHIREGRIIPGRVSLLFQNFPNWNRQQIEVVEWLRKKRNLLQHTGEAHWEDKAIIRQKLLESYELTGGTYEYLGYALSEVFTHYEQSILSAKEIGWMDEAYLLTQGSFKYYEYDPEIAIQISNAALEIAIRGLAKSWRIKDAEIIPIPDLVQSMYDNKYVFTADIPISYEDWQSEPFYFQRETHDYGWLRCDCLINYDELIKRANGSRVRLHEEVKIALEDTRDVVMSFIKNAPYLDYFESIVTKWGYIISELQSRVPGISIPTLDEKFGIYAWWNEKKSITIHLNEVRKAIGWQEEHEGYLLDSIICVCGEKPNDLILIIRWADFNPFLNRAVIIVTE